MGHKSLRFAFYGLRDVSKTREKSVRDDILNKLYNDGLLENLSKKFRKYFQYEFRAIGKTL